MWFPPTQAFVLVLVFCGLWTALSMSVDFDFLNKKVNLVYLKSVSFGCLHPHILGNQDPSGCMRKLRLLGRGHKLLLVAGDSGGNEWPEWCNPDQSLLYGLGWWLWLFFEWIFSFLIVLLKPTLKVISSEHRLALWGEGGEEHSGKELTSLCVVNCVEPAHSWTSQGQQCVGAVQALTWAGVHVLLYLAGN